MSKELEAFLEYVQVIRALSAKTLQAYESDLTFIELESNRSLIDLESADIFKILSKIENKRTLNRKLSAINSFLNFCHSYQYSSTLTKFSLSKIPKNLPKFLPYESIMSDLNRINRQEWLGLRDYALLLFLYATGMRISECLSMREDDIEKDWIRIRHAKGEKERYIPIADTALKALREYQIAKPAGEKYMWINYRYEPLSRISAFKICQKYLGVSPHTLRHSYATALILGGADLRVVQELLGHASLLTTQIYTHVQKHHLYETVLVCHPMSRKVG